MRTKNFKNYFSILAIVNYRNRLNASHPLIFFFFSEMTHLSELYQFPLIKAENKELTLTEV